MQRSWRNYIYIALYGRNEAECGIDSLYGYHMVAIVTFITSIFHTLLKLKRNFELAVPINLQEALGKQFKL